MIRKMLDLYFAPKFFERNGRIYRWLGVRVFKKFLPSGDYVIRWTGTWMIEGHSTKEIRGYEFFTRVYETIHAFGFVVFILSLGLGLLGIVLNLLINIYPIMVQRYNRARIYRVLEHRKLNVGTEQQVRESALYLA